MHRKHDHIIRINSNRNGCYTTIQETKQETFLSQSFDVGLPSTLTLIQNSVISFSRASHFWVPNPIGGFPNIFGIFHVYETPYL